MQRFSARSPLRRRSPRGCAQPRLTRWWDRRRSLVLVRRCVVSLSAARHHHYSSGGHQAPASRRLRPSLPPPFAPFPPASPQRATVWPRYERQSPQRRSVVRMVSRHFSSLMSFTDSAARSRMRCCRMLSRGRSSWSALPPSRRHAPSRPRSFRACAPSASRHSPKKISPRCSSVHSTMRAGLAARFLLTKMRDGS